MIWLVVRYLATAIPGVALLVYGLAIAVQLPKVWRWVVGALSGLLVAGAAVATAAARTLGTNQYRIPLMLGGAVGVGLMYLGAALVVIAAVNLVWRLVTVRAPRARSPRLTVVRILTVVGLVGALGTTGYGFIQAQQPVVTAYTVTSPRVPAAFDGLRIALVTDLHVGATTRNSFLPLVVDQVNAAQPDLIVVAGDVIDGTVAELRDRVAILKNLAAPYGVVVTTGNHDWGFDAAAWLALYRSLGLTVLNNDGITLERAGQSIAVLGINDRYGTGTLKPNLQQAYDRVQPTGYTILVAHEPSQVAAQNKLAGRLGVDLQLSGHTHGGQLWPFGYLALLEEPVLDGQHDIAGVTVITSRGVGTWGPPIRVGADPEIPVITLRRG